MGTHSRGRIIMVAIMVVPLLVTLVGCGSSTDVSQRYVETDPDSINTTSAAAQTGSTSLDPSAEVPSPTDVVSQFLDRVRRGGQDSDAGILLTTRAQSELNRIGRRVQPIGSPDASFHVTRSEAVPGEAGSMLVHSIWSEPTGDGTNTDYQVVWAVQRETNGWRISGLAMELQPGQPPTIIDFENGDLMAQLLDDGGESGKSSEAAASQAAAPVDAVAR